MAQRAGSALLMCAAGVCCLFWGAAFLQAAPSARASSHPAGLRGVAGQAASEGSAIECSTSMAAFALAGAFALGAVSRARARSARRAEGSSQWVNEQSPGMSHPSGLYFPPYVPEKKAEEFDYDRATNKKDTSRSQVGSGQPKWDITDNYKGKFS
mmetsp:Transcript_116147/g.308943  ORF Transcript_116147/g.308943 Transcript_116147/m.308943 type:complete len:155 (-) Transcript_116147:106-570(-)